MKKNDIYLELLTAILRGILVSLGNTEDRTLIQSYRNYALKTIKMASDANKEACEEIEDVAED